MWGFFIYYICGMATPIKKDPPEDEGLDILQALANIYNWKENVAENINPRSYGFLEILMLLGVMILF
tara:strand:+ start:258 stop:458 length:201 start_codon:yes stop_codon:yes gene_type:complete